MSGLEYTPFLSNHRAAEQMITIWIGRWDLSKSLVYFWITQRFGFSPSRYALWSKSQLWQQCCVFLRGKVFVVPPNAHVASIFQLRISGSVPALYYLSFCNWHSIETGLLSPAWPKIEKQFVLIFFQLEKTQIFPHWNCVIKTQCGVDQFWVFPRGWV